MFTLYGLVKTWIAEKKPCTVCNCEKHKREHALIMCRQKLPTFFPCQIKNTCYLCLLETADYGYYEEWSCGFAFRVKCFDPNCLHAKLNVK